MSNSVMIRPFETAAAVVIPEDNINAPGYEPNRKPVDAQPPSISMATPVTAKATIEAHTMRTNDLAEAVDRLKA